MGDDAQKAPKHPHGGRVGRGGRSIFFHQGSFSITSFFSGYQRSMTMVLNGSGPQMVFSHAPRHINLCITRGS